MKSLNERVTALEEEAAHLRRQNEELSNEVLSQWQRIEQLEKRLGRLQDRFVDLEGQIEPPESGQKPPHW